MTTTPGGTEKPPQAKRKYKSEIVDPVEKAFQKLGYTQPGQSLNVATAKSLARNAAFDAKVEAETAMYQRCCMRCQAQFDRERGGVF